MGYSSSASGLYVPWKETSAAAGALSVHLVVTPSDIEVVAILTGLDFAVQGPGAVTFAAVAQVGGVPFFSNEQNFGDGFGYASWRGSLPLATDQLNCEIITAPASVELGIVAWGYYVNSGGTLLSP